MRKMSILLALILPPIIILMALLFPVIPYVIFFIVFMVLLLIIGSIYKWDDAMLKTHMHEILKIEATFVVFGISLGGLLLQYLAEIVDVNQIVSFLLLSSGFLAFSLILGLFYLVTKEDSELKKWAGWSAIISFLYGLFCVLLGWSLAIKPLLEALAPSFGL